MKARVDAKFECEADLLAKMTGGGEGVKCAAQTQGYLKMCIASVIEGGVKVLQPISVGAESEIKSGWIMHSDWVMHSEGGSILFACPDHVGLVELRRAQLKGVAEEKEMADGDSDSGGESPAGG